MKLTLQQFEAHLWGAANTRTLQGYLGHRSIQSTVRYTVRYTELSPMRFKDFWRD